MAHFFMKKLSLQGKGKLGERIAEGFLVKKGYQIIERRFYSRQGEIDLIVVKDKMIIFVEVKMRTSDLFGEPEQSIGPRKIRRINKTIYKFLAKNPRYNNYDPCLDVVSIELSGRRARVRHYENIMVELP